MRKHLWITAVLAWLPLLAGCGSTPEPEAAAPDQPEMSKLTDKSEVVLAELLKKPRAELAEMADEWQTRAQLQEKSRREGRLNCTLLPHLRLPLAVPVWREAKFSPALGIAVPPYLGDTGPDNALALHLARYGDQEAAHKLADGTVRQQIDAFRYQQNYPAEWTRLVALMLQVAQMRLATGDVDAGSELVGLHRQLREVLDVQAASGPLGAALLAPGRIALTTAAEAWKQDKRPDLAEQAEGFLAQWGDVPQRTLPVKPGASRAEVSRLLASPAKGFALVAPYANRALDLFDLPVPGDGVQAVTAFFDRADKLDEVLVSYRIQTNEFYPRPPQFGHVLEDGRHVGQDVPAAVNVTRRSYQLDGVRLEVGIASGGAGLGALVRLGEGKATGSVPRTFGAVSLDRSLEGQRLLLAPEQRGEALRVGQGPALAQFANPLPALKPAELVLQQEAGQDLTASLLLRYETLSGGLPPLHEIVGPLWSKLGPGRMEAVVDATGGHLALTWEDAQTTGTLRLPFDHARPAELEFRDRQGPAALAQRAEQAAQAEHAERLERLKAGKPLARLPRQLEDIPLGMTKAQVLRALPTGRAVLKQEIADGLNVVFTAEPARGVVYLARQLFVRFDGAGRAVEVRARYFDVPGGRPNWVAGLLASYKKAGGAPREVAAPWGKAWADLAARKPAPTQFVWQDDVTRLTCQRDAGILEVTLRDCPAEHPHGIDLPPLRYLPLGVEACVLGAARDEVLKKWGVTNPTTTADGAIVLAPRSQAAYDVLLVWFEGDRVTRVVARHTLAKGAKVGPERMGAALTETWGRDLRALGWPVRQDFTPQDAPLSLGFLDDQTRVRVFWQENDDGSCRLFTEWRALPRP